MFAEIGYYFQKKLAVKKFNEPQGQVTHISVPRNVNYRW